MRKIKASVSFFFLAGLFSIRCFAGSNACNPAPTCDSTHRCGDDTGVCIIQVGSDASAKGVTNAGGTVGGGTMSGGQFVCVHKYTSIVFVAAPAATLFNFSVDFTSSPFHGAGTHFTGGTSLDPNNPWIDSDYVNAPSSPTACFGYTVKVPGGCPSGPGCTSNDPAVIIDDNRTLRKPTKKK